MTVARKLNRHSHSNDEQVVQIDLKNLAKLAWTKIVSRPFAGDQEIQKMMSELQAGQYSHTWRWFDIGNGEKLMGRLQAFENERRNTKLCFYYGIGNDGKEHFIGAGAIAEKISHKFSVPGFPVVSRCYVLNAFRGNRFYEPFLQHRIDVCREDFGHALKGVHLGTSNARVFAALRKGFFQAPFLYLGNEQLEGHGDLIVKDFLLLSPRYRTKLAAAIAKLPGCAQGRCIAEELEGFLANKNNETFYHYLITSFSELDSKHRGFGDTIPELKDFMQFLAAVPVDQIEHASPTEDLFPPVQNRQGGDR